MSGRCFFHPGRCSDDGKGIDSFSAMQPGERPISSSLLWLFISAQVCKDKKPLEVSESGTPTGHHGHPYNHVSCVEMK